MQERLVEHWLTNVNELGYQIPFCEVLVARRFDVIHVSTHGRGEHGKDVIARDRKGRLCTFQLKGGDITLNEWREIQGEVSDLVQLPVRVPGARENEPHTPYLVTNGEIRGDAVESIVRYRDEWVRRGSPQLRVITRRTLLRWFLRAQGRFLPATLPDFRRFVELYVADFRDRLPRESFAELLIGVSPTSDHTRSRVKAIRALAAVAVVAGYVTEQYERAENYVAAAEAWTIVGATILHVAERDNLERSIYEPVLSLVGVALDRCLEAFTNESLSRENFGEAGQGIADPFVYGTRVALTFGWLSATALRRAVLRHAPLDASAVIKTLKREFRGMRFGGEVDWPGILMLAIYAEQILNAREAEGLITLWVRWVLAQNQQNGPGVPSPYWLQERIIAWLNGMLAPNEAESFVGATYTLPAALDMLVRRLRRQAVTRLWPASSRLHWCDFRPDSLAEYFLWHVDKGVLDNRMPPLEAHWNEWRERTSMLDESTVPELLRRHPEWLPSFLLTYPHRANSILSAFADRILGRRGRSISMSKTDEHSQASAKASDPVSSDEGSKGKRAPRRRQRRETQVASQCLTMQNSSAHIVSCARRSTP